MGTIDHCQAGRNTASVARFRIAGDLDQDQQRGLGVLPGKLDNGVLRRPPAERVSAHAGRKPPKRCSLWLSRMSFDHAFAPVPYQFCRR